MSKSKKSTKKVLLGVGTLLLFLGIIVAGLLIYAVIANSISNSHISKRIDLRYSGTVTMPASLHLNSKHYQGRAFWDDSPGTQESMLYTYTPVSKHAKFNKVYDSVKQSLVSSGYTISPTYQSGSATNATRTTDLAHMSAAGHHLDLEVNIYGNDNNTDSNAAVRNVWMSVTEQVNGY